MRITRRQLRSIIREALAKRAPRRLREASEQQTALVALLDSLGEDAIPVMVDYVKQHPDIVKELMNAAPEVVSSFSAALGDAPELAQTVLGSLGIGTESGGV